MTIPLPQYQDSPPDYPPEAQSSPFAAPGYNQVSTTQWYHIYRESIYDRNAHVKHQDKTEHKFYVHFHYERPQKQVGYIVVVRPWKYDFHWVDKNGPIAMSIEPILQSAKQFPDFLIKDNATRKEIIIDRGSSFSRKYKWELDGVTYCWKGMTLSANMQLLQYPEKKVVAMYHRNSRFSFKKEGKMAIEPEYYGMTNIIIVTGMAAEIWEYGDEDDLDTGLSVGK
ncbi:hypothetical protein HK103_001105 [Boothiomyces macroporosus]|uniref:Uncharacterized protein n=1 Tax=Boothiomyces macroporosus TaxID=261099 RepID=A0AAD5UB50_9FUNG|nr:hypothetical protein HK103_001099 [Boothiomyces macroporosus]KAJ3252909.1 hypothetical protein HK103_001105 [Boothiomyces macroporosus]